jgi:hypothetical protein
MATVKHIGLYDKVELLEPVENAPAGATGVVLEFHGDGDFAMVEFTSMPPEPLLDRIVIVPVSRLGLIESRSSDSSD